MHSVPITIPGAPHNFTLTYIHSLLSSFAYSSKLTHQFAQETAMKTFLRADLFQQDELLALSRRQSAVVLLSASGNSAAPVYCDRCRVLLLSPGVPASFPHTAHAIPSQRKPTYQFVTTVTQFFLQPSYVLHVYVEN